MNKYIFSLLISLFIYEMNAQVVISEIMYNPQEVDLPYPDYDSREDAEYLELTNIGSNSVDISDWCVLGIQFCFANGTTIAPNQYIVLAKEGSIFQSVYGSAAFDTYAGTLSNGGEKISLIDQNGNLVNEVKYKDVHPWPVLADGEGASLELLYPYGNILEPYFWQASLATDGHTAGSANSTWINSAPPIIDSVIVNTQSIQANTAVSLSLHGQNISSAKLFYVINRVGVEIELMMSQVTATEYSVTVPGQAAGDFVRYRVEATNNTYTTSYPRTDDVINYHGYVVPDANRPPSNFPILDWHVHPDSLDTKSDRHSVIIYGDQVFDNAYVWYRRNKHWKVELPKGQKIHIEGHTTYPVNEFQINRPDHAFWGRISGTMGRTVVYTDVIAEGGEPRLDAFNIRLDLNGNLQDKRIWTFLQWPNNEWRQKNGFEEEGAEYWKYPSDQFKEQKFPGDGDSTKIHAMHLLKDTPGPHMFDNYDVPGLVNVAALQTIICHWDAGTKNYFMDMQPNQRWNSNLWDMDAVPLSGVEELDTSYCRCAEVPYGSPSPYNQGHQYAKGMLENTPRINQMYYRRLRTLIEKFYAPGYLANKLELFSPLSDLEIQSTAEAYNGIYDLATLDSTRHQVFTEYPIWQKRRHDEKPGFPGPASGMTPVVINEIQYAPEQGDGAEFVELYNTSTTESIDLSGWKIEGIGLTLSPGTVILPNDFLVVASWSPTFINTYGVGKYVAADFNGSRLSNAGEAVVLRDVNDAVIDSVFYGLPNWKGAFGGPSLERINPLGSSIDPTNWALSSVVGGSPDAANSPDPAQNNLPPLPASIAINEIMYHACEFGDLKEEVSEYIELINYGTTVVDLSAYYFTDGIEFVFTSGSSLQPGQLLVLAANPLIFENQYGFTPFGEFKGSLHNAGEKIQLVDAKGNSVDLVEYNDKLLWNPLADGDNAALELIDPTLDNSSPINWYAGSQNCGSPGVANVNNCTSQHGIVINEINYNSNNAVTEPGDWVELFNSTASPVDISGWSFQSKDSLFVFPTGTILQAQTYLVLVENETSFTTVFPHVTNYIGSFNFNLSGKGDNIGVFTQAGCPVDLVSFDDTLPWPEEADGDGPTLSLIDPSLNNELVTSWQGSHQINAPYGTPGRVNEAFDLSVLMINEIAYNPKNNQNVYHTKLEFIELKNTSTEYVDLVGLQIPAVNHTVNERIIIGPQEFVILAKDTAVFSSFYGLTAQAQYAGNLSNTGETIQLMDYLNTALDRVTYDRTLPWDTIPGEGIYSLALIDGAFDNDSPVNWSAQSVQYTPLAENVFDGSQFTDYSGLEINEIHFRPTDTNLEFIEIKNKSNTSIRLADIKLVGVGFTFEDTDFIEPNSFLVLTKSDASYVAEYGQNPFASWEDAGRLNNSSEYIKLVDLFGNTIDDVFYRIFPPWDHRTVSGEYSLALKLGGLDNSLPTSWSIQCDFVTPGSENVFDTDNDGVCDPIDICPFADDALIGQACDDNNSCTVGEIYNTECECTGGQFQDSDNDGICDADDSCPGVDDGLIGTACEDGDACTEGETYNAACFCTGGVIVDSDDDGICDGDDVCPGLDDALINAQCDDGDNCTIGESYDADCNCTGGVLPDANNNQVCDELEFTCDIELQDDFEMGVGNWTLGGPDAAHVMSEHSPSGDYALRIRDNSMVSSSIISTHLNLGQVEYVIVNFKFTAIGLSPTEDFLFEISTDGGSVFVPYRSWSMGTDFMNGVVYAESVGIDNSAVNTTTTFRFRCDASINFDEIFLDDIVINYCEKECTDYDVLIDNSQITSSRLTRIGIESNGTIPAGQSIDFNAGDYILLRPGFEVEQQVSFHAYILGCN